MSYLSKQRIERILVRCFQQHHNDVEPEHPELFNVDLNITMVRWKNGRSPMWLRRKEIVNRILNDFQKKNILYSSDSIQLVDPNS